jgi:hypothetical protein
MVRECVLMCVFSWLSGGGSGGGGCWGIVRTEECPATAAAEVSAAAATDKS